MAPVKISLITAVLAVLMLLCPCQVKSQNCSNDTATYYGEIRLRDGPTPREGRLDICVSASWYSLCNESLGIEEFQVICRELGFCMQGGKTSLNYYSVPFDSFRASCTGEETTLAFSSCQLSLCGYHTSVQGVNCSAEIPYTPVDVVIQVIDSYTIQVSWSPPNMSDCTDIDEYRVYCDSHDSPLCFFYSLPTVATNSTNITLHNYFLLQNCVYECCVSGYNSAGEGTENCASRPRPTPPRNVSVSPILSSPTSLLVKWVEPEQLNGRFNEYRVMCGTVVTFSNNITLTTLEVTGLSVLTTYTCCVSVHISYMYMSAQECGNATTYLEPPSPPKDVNVIEVTAMSLHLEWTNPEFNVTLSNYTIYCTGTINQVWLGLNSINTSVNVTGLQPYTNYTCCVSASNQAGEGNQTCVSARTLAVPPTKPENAEIISTDSRSLTLTWREPVDSYGGVLFYTISCSQLQDLDPVQFNTSANTLRKNVTNLQPFTNYTCCVSASNQAGQESQSCVSARTQPAPPTKPEGISTIYNDIDNLTLAWREPAESYGQDILFYSISCISLSNHTITIESVLRMSAHVTGLNSNTNYTCCVSAVSSVGPGNSACISVSIAGQTQMDKRRSLDVAVAVSGGALLALLAILLVVITVIVCQCFKKRKLSPNKTQQRPKTGEISVQEKDSDFNKSIIINTQADDVLYRPDYKEEVEIRYERPNTSSSAQSGRAPKRPDYKEEVEIRNGRPVLKSRTKAESKLEQNSEQRMSQKPHSQEEQRNDSTSTQYDKQDTERIYQPLIPPKTYMEPAVSSAYQDLTFETREPRSEADGSEGQYETVRRSEETNQYEPLTFGVSTGPQTDGGYQTLTKRDEGSHYQDLHSVRT